MKTTIDIADALLLRAKRLAVKRGTTLKVVVEQALRRELAEARGLAVVPPLVTHVVGGAGLRQGLSWDDWDAIRELSYQGRGA